MDWIMNIIKDNTAEDGTVDQDAVKTAVNKQFPKEAVVKSVYNQKAEEVNDLRAQVDTLQTDSASVQDLKDQLEAAQSDLKKERTAAQVDAALKEAGGTKADYLKYKLGDLELDEEGNVKELSEKIAALKEAEPDFFEVQDKAPADAPDDQDAGTKNGLNGYNVIDNKLDQGKEISQEAKATADFEKALGIKTE